MILNLIYKLIQILFYIINCSIYCCLKHMGHIICCLPFYRIKFGILYTNWQQSCSAWYFDI